MERMAILAAIRSPAATGGQEVGAEEGPARALADRVSGPPEDLAGTPPSSRRRCIPSGTAGAGQTRQPALCLHLLELWLAEARHRGLDEFTDVARKIDEHRAEIDACLSAGLNNGLVESLNTKFRLIIRRAFGFRDVHALIALAQLGVGQYQPLLPT